MMMQTIKSLLQQGILIEGEPEFKYITPDVSVGVAQGLKLTSTITVYNFSQFDGLNQVSVLIKSLKTDQKLNLVLVDDYLDPRLNSLNSSFIANKKNWMLLKLTGEQLISRSVIYPPCG